MALGTFLAASPTALVLNRNLVMSLPESPRWLCKKGRYEDAGVVFAALDDVDIDHPSVKAQIEEVRATLPLVESGGVKDIFSVGKEKVRAMLMLRSGRFAC